MSVGRRQARPGAIAALCLAVAAAALFASPVHAATPTIPDQPFTGTSVPAADWITGGLNRVPCITAASVNASGSLPACPGGPLDPVGEGALRLTDDVVQGGFAILNSPIDTSDGLRISFDFFEYDTTDPGDGMSFFLIDGAASPTQAGSYGGGMGYASYHPNGVAGLVGGYVGVAFDAYGAFSDPGIGGGGTGTFTPNSIAVRGDEASDYYLLSSHVAAGQLAVPTATHRNDARRHVVVTISTLNVMSIDVDYGSGLITEISGLDLATVNGPGSLPTSLKLGFAGSTGGAYLTNEIQNFQIQTLAPDLAISLSATPVDLSTRSSVITANVMNDAATGATNDTVTVTSSLPTGVTPGVATGTGWTCTTSGQLVTCSRSGTGADRLAAGEAAPPISIPVHVGAGAVLPVTVSATVAVLDDSSTANDTRTTRLVSAELAATGASMAPGLVAPALLAVLLGVALLISRRRRPRTS